MFGSVDWADYADKTAAVSVTLAGAANANVEQNGVDEDPDRNIDDVQGGSAHDVVGGGRGVDELGGLGGNDILGGGGGAPRCGATP